MTDSKKHFEKAYYLISEIGGLGYATDSKEQYDRAVCRNYLEAVEAMVGH
jgi:hypothetical protein